MGKKGYNVTELSVYPVIERGISHRDWWAHALRYNHVLNIAKIGMNIMDFGSGKGELFETFYRNRYSPKRFLGLDIRKSAIDFNKEKFPKAEWIEEDLVKMETNYGKYWDIITSFEVIEHISKHNAQKFLNNIKRHCNENTIVLISTPCYDEKTGAADNHTYDGGDGRGKAVQEFTYEEMEELLQNNFEIIDKFGTFASQKDYKKHMSTEEDFVWNQLNKYYDSNLMSVIFAPLYPEYSRNVIWKLKLK